jgi:hypothetical protein
MSATVTSADGAPHLQLAHPRSYAASEVNP